MYKALDSIPSTERKKENLSQKIITIIEMVLYDYISGYKS
jgi:hypothetical protein